MQVEMMMMMWVTKTMITIEKCEEWDDVFTRTQIKIIGTGSLMQRSLDLLLIAVMHATNMAGGCRLPGLLC